MTELEKIIAKKEIRDAGKTFNETKDFNFQKAWIVLKNGAVEYLKDFIKTIVRTPPLL